MTVSWGARNFVCVSLTLLLIAAAVRGQSTSSQRLDTQSWNDVQFTVPMTKRIDFLLLGHLRIGDSIRRPVNERFGVGLFFTLNQYLRLFGNYLHIEMQPAGGVTSHEERLSFGGTVRFQVGRFTLGDRNVFEHRFRSPQVNATRYRNRLQVEHPLGPKQAKLSVFVNDEVFYDWSLSVWPRNRISIGLSRQFNKHFTGEVYYLRQNDSHTKPGDLHVIGTTMRFHL